MDRTPNQEPDKKPYRAPSLQHYGNLGRITSSVMGMGMSDGAMHPTKNKTS
jgi:hypothetical protein